MSSRKILLKILFLNFYFSQVLLLTPNNTIYRRKLPPIPHFSFSGGFFRQLLPTRNISILLDNLLKGYDRKLRPRFGGSPTIVEIDIEVRSMGQISEMDMTFSMDCYFRQSWLDERLAFSDAEESFTLSLSVLERLWKPDTFIYNGQHSYTHIITTPNRFIRLHHSGKILYSSRLTIQASCPMNLENFPMDTQRCPLTVGSFGYTTKDVLYKWNEKRQLVIAADMKLSQFDLIAAPSGFTNTTRRYDEHSILLASFFLQRHMGNFLIQVYGPCMLLVVLSWVSFWLNREATADRISLGVTTILTMTFLGLESRKDLPKVSYSTALDLFVWISYSFIFATVIEFALVHYFTKFGTGEDLLTELDSEPEEVTDNAEEGSSKLEERKKVLGNRSIPESKEHLENKGQGYLPNGSEHDVNSQISVKNNCNEDIPSTKLTEKKVKNTDKIEIFPHSSLPRHIERNLSLDLPVCTNELSRKTRATEIDLKDNTITDIGMREFPITTSKTEDIILRNKKTATEQTFTIKTDIQAPPQLLCQACNTRLKDRRIDSVGDSSCGRRNKKGKSVCAMFLTYCYEDRCNIVKSRKRVKQARDEESKRKIPKDQQMNSVSKIDEISRYLFPFSFLFINFIYWYSYLSHSRRLLSKLEPPTYAPSPY